MEKLKTAFRGLAGDEARIMGLLFGVFVLIAILSGLLLSPRLGTVDSGRYEKIMDAAGLDYTRRQKAEGDLQYARVLEEYDYTHFSYAKLFAPAKDGSIIYPIALIRLLTEPFGLRFSTVYLYLLYALLAALAVYMIVRSAACLWERFGVIPGVLLVLLFADPNLTAYFGSLYETGTLIAALALFGGCVLRGFTYRKGEGTGAVWPAVLASVFLLNATSRAVVFIPVVVIALAGLAVREWDPLRKKTGQALLLACLIVCSVYSSVCYFGTDPDNISDAASYHAVFMGILPASRNPEADLAELGLDAGYLEDIGKSYYLDSGEYAHDPREEAEAVFSAINTETVLRWHLRHPVKSARTVLNRVSGMGSLESEWILGVGQNARDEQRVTRYPSLAGMLGKLLLPDGYAFFIASAGLVILLSAGLWIARAIRGYDRATRWIAPAVLIAACLSALLYLPLHVVLMGTEALDLDRIAAVFCLFAVWAGLLPGACKAAKAGSVWFRRIYEEGEPDVPEEAGGDEEFRLGRRIFQTAREKAAHGFKTISGSRGRTVLAVLALALVMVCSVELANPRAGTVNNGDYGRMMEQLGLTWTGDVYFDNRLQAGTYVVENYAYLSGFDFASLTSLKPTYSLVYPVAAVRGICRLFGLQFSTWYVAWLMSAVVVLCILSIVRDLHDVLKKYTVVLGIGLCLILLSEGYLVWFNSMFGEGSIFMGVMMVAACCVHLSVLPQGKGALWVFLLAFSSMVLTTAKAQTMVALPVVLVLILVFAYYHRPLRTGRLVAYLLLCMACMGMISFKAVRVYQDNNDVSERHTVWQSVFYGALMISGDPIGDMEELGIPVEMAADIGKHAYLADEEYVISPNSEEADTALYDHIDTFTMVRYYLKRPLQLLRMLDHAADTSQEVYSGFRAYLGQNYSEEHSPVDRWGIWQYWRPLFAFAHFWKYVAVYGAVLFYGVFQLRRRELAVSRKLLVVSYLGIMIIGAFQFPLTSIGNGFADNHKQLFGFMLCHDLLLLLGLPVLLLKLGRIREAALDRGAANRKRNMRAKGGRR